jgi:putative spermidine/putrescine transport system permease protein
MTEAAASPRPLAAPTPPRRGLPGLRWLGVLPFFVFVTLFLLLPTLHIVLGAFQRTGGGWTIQNILDLNTPSIRNAYWVSIKVSFWSALLGCLVGFLMAASVVLWGVSRRARNPLLTFSGVASNFAGVPLAFAFIATIGPAGLITLWLRSEMGIICRRGSGTCRRASGWPGSCRSRCAFPLHDPELLGPDPDLSVLPDPADDPDHHARPGRAAAGMAGGLRGAGGERPSSIGGWWPCPILFPSMLGCMALLFANAFGAVATAIALTGPALNIAPILLYAQIRGDVLGNPNLGYALALGMIVITALANAIYIVLRARSERWLK